MTEFISWASEFDFYKGELNWQDLPLSDRMTIVRYELDGVPEDVNIEKYIMATKLRRIQFDGLRTVIVRIALSLEDVLGVRFGVDKNANYSLILPYIQKTALGHELGTLYKGSAHDRTSYRMGELEFLAQSGSNASPLDNLLDLPKHLQLQGILEILKPNASLKLESSKEASYSEPKEHLLEAKYESLQKLAHINSPTEEKGLHAFVVSVHSKILEKLGPNITNDVEMDEEYDNALFDLYRSAYRQCFSADKKTKEEIANSLLNIAIPFYIAHKGDRTRCLERMKRITKEFDKFKSAKPVISSRPSAKMKWWKEKVQTKAERQLFVHGIIGLFLSFIGLGFAINNNGMMAFALFFGEGGIIAALLIWAGIALIIRSIVILFTPYNEWLNGK